MYYRKLRRAKRRKTEVVTRASNEKVAVDRKAETALGTDRRVAAARDDRKVENGRADPKVGNEKRRRRPKRETRAKVVTGDDHPSEKPRKRRRLGSGPRVWMHPTSEKRKTAITFGNLENLFTVEKVWGI